MAGYDEPATALAGFGALDFVDLATRTCSQFVVIEKSVNWNVASAPVVETLSTPKSI